MARGVNKHQFIFGSEVSSLIVPLQSTGVQAMKKDDGLGILWAIQLYVVDVTTAAGYVSAASRG